VVAFGVGFARRVWNGLVVQVVVQASSVVGVEIRTGVGRNPLPGVVEVQIEDVFVAQVEDVFVGGG
jgi:hypothetical protein